MPVRFSLRGSPFSLFKFKVLPLVLALAFLLSAGGHSHASYADARASYYKLMDDNAGSRDPSRWRSVGDAFAAGATGTKLSDGLYMAGLCYERAHRLSSGRADAKTALEHYSNLYAKAPASSLADDALFRSARLNENLGDLEKARELYKLVTSGYPSGDMAELAAQRVGEVGKAIRIMGVRHFSGPDYTRIVLDLSGLAPYEAKRLAANRAAGLPERVFIDLKTACVDETCAESVDVLDGLVSKVRTGQYDKDTARVVMDLAGEAEYRVFPLISPARLVIDLFRKNGAEGDLVADLIGKKGNAVAPPAGSAPGAEKSAQRPRTRKFRIVLDPGHGGKDPGAVGYGKLQEKVVAMKIAREVKYRLERALDCEVRLTRERDTALSLSARTAMANRYGADLFISIHANASPKKSARGIETYYLDRSSDRSARRVAAAENRTSESGVRETEQILADVLLNMKLPESRRLAEAVQRALCARVAKSFGPVRDLGVKRAPFYVLTGAVMPAILVETAFITNKTEAGWLSSAKYHGVVADAVVVAVTEYVGGL